MGRRCRFRGAWRGLRQEHERERRVVRRPRVTCRRATGGRLAGGRGRPGDSDRRPSTPGLLDDVLEAPRRRHRVEIRCDVRLRSPFVTPNGDVGPLPLGDRRPAGDGLEQRREAVGPVVAVRHRTRSPTTGTGGSIRSRLPVRDIRSSVPPGVPSETTTSSTDRVYSLACLPDWRTLVCSSSRPVAVRRSSFR